MSRQIFPHTPLIDKPKIAEDSNFDMIYANGDSVSWGAELGDESEEYRTAHGYPGLIANAFNVPLVNNSFPGCSNSRIFRTTIKDVARLKFENKTPLVIIGLTELHRFELYDAVKKEWINFNNPDVSPDKEFSDKLWHSYSSDYSDFQMLLSQVMALIGFLKSENVPYIVYFNCMSVFSNLIGIDEFKVFKKNVERSNFIYTFSMIGFLQTFIDVKWKPNRHPDETGHKIIADFLTNQLRQRYNFKSNQSENKS